MKTIVVSKTGNGPFWCPGKTHKQTSKGEMGATIGLLYHLSEWALAGRYRVVYLGPVTGELPPGIEHIEANLLDLDASDTGAKHLQRLNEVTEPLVGMDPFVMINSVGASSSMSYLGNPRMVTPQRFPVCYASAALYACERFKLPRVCFTTDIRCVPREQEMSECWSHVRPVAFFSQKDARYYKVVGGKKYEVTEKHGGQENWHTYRREEWEPIQASLFTPDAPSGVNSDAVKRPVIIAHAHMQTGFKQIERDAVFKKILGETVTSAEFLQLKSLGLRIYGTGWEHWSGGFDPEVMVGPCTPAEVCSILRQSSCGVMVPPENSDYVTSKLRYHSWCGCLPLLYGKGEDWTYDKGERYVELKSELRVDNPHQFISVASRCGDDHMRQTVDFHCKQINKITTPSFALLDRCVDYIATGADVQHEDWFEEFGGYRAIGNDE